MALMRKGTFDAAIWAAIEHEYPTLPTSFAPGEIVLDLGCHTGAVCQLAAERGATVVGYEANRENYSLAVINLQGVPSITLHNAAVWRSDVAPTRLLFTPSADSGNTGGGSVAFATLEDHWATRPTEGAEPGGEAAPGAAILPALAKADPKKGEGDVALCKVCHSFDKGAPSPVGPNLYGVVGRKIASFEGFSYSPALKGKQGEGEWTFEHLDLWLTNPQAFASGTTMAFPGLPDLATRADVIAFLRTKSDNPVPLPAAAALAPKVEGARPPPAPAAETPAAHPPSAAAPPPSAETPPAPSAETPAAPPPSAGTPAAPAPSTEKSGEETQAAPEAEAAPASPPSAEDASEPSTGRQPQPVYPDGELQ